MLGRMLVGELDFDRAEYAAIGRSRSAAQQRPANQHQSGRNLIVTGGLMNGKDPMASDDPPSVSVIVPCYNVATYLADAIESVLDQEHQADEIIVVDDGSVDASAALVTARFGSRVRYQYQPHQGIGAARNRGIRLARAHCIAFLDADDLWPPASLGARLEFLAAAAGVDCVYGLAEQFISCDLDSAARAALHCQTGARPARLAGAMLIRRSVFDRIGVFDISLKVGETMDWLARFEESKLVAAAVDLVVLKRRIHGKNTVIKEKHRQSDYLKVLKASLDRRRAQQHGSTPRSRS
jgi:glycosyltransferase involved in cell wall biosynthesis